MKTEILKVTGMASEAATIDVIRALSRVNGVQTVKVSYAGKSATVLFDENRTATQELMVALADAGFSRDVLKEAELAQGSCCGGCCGS
jgi:mercuric ion binding protein